MTNFSKWGWSSRNSVPCNSAEEQTPAGIQSVGLRRLLARGATHAPRCPATLSRLPAGIGAPPRPEVRSRRPRAGRGRRAATVQCPCGQLCGWRSRLGGFVHGGRQSPLRSDLYLVANFLIAVATCNDCIGSVVFAFARRIYYKF